MKFQATLAALATILPCTLADFHIYYTYTTSTIGPEGTVSSYSVMPVEANCDQIGSAKAILPQDDVSGGKAGVRCVDSGAGCYADEGPPSSVLEFEMNWLGDNSLHFTLYKDRGYELTGTDGTVHGKCQPVPGYYKYCEVGGIIGEIEACRMFKCTSDLEVKDFHP